jgi:predicted dithiol-disulfide oxidoreductase (DUF899 family)
VNLPEVVSPEEWQAARERLLAEEKEATRARDALAAERRRLPMIRSPEGRPQTPPYEWWRRHDEYSTP